jgi:anaerobic selenocysteine-containing dehydrogenase
MSNAKIDRREFIKASGALAAGAALAAALPGVADAEATTSAVADFDICKTFAGFIQDIGGTPADGGGKSRAPAKTRSCAATPASARRGSFNRTLQ